MCGICGVINKGNYDVNEAALKKMTDVLSHRGPDGEGIYIRKNIGLGHRRLAIIDLTENAKQPMSNEEGTIWIVFNGMIYNYKELTNDLKNKGHTFKSQSDTETIIHLYEEFGRDCVKFLRGMFAFAIWDEAREELILARDRIGQKPLVYAESEGLFIFASEPKAIFASGGIHREIDMTGLHHFFSYKSAPWPYTVYKKVKQLPPASILSFRRKDNSAKITKYWKPDLSLKLNISLKESVERMRYLLEESVKLSLISDVSGGALLSGGIDSSSVVAMMSRFMKQPVETFSVGYETREKKDPEFNFSRIISREFNTNHHQISLGHQMINSLPKMLWFYDEPYANLIALPTFELCRIMKKDVTIVLSGDGGDEIFAGYPGYLKWKAVYFINKLFPYISKTRKDAFSFIAGKNRTAQIISQIFAPAEKKRSLPKALFSQGLYAKLYTEEFRNEINEINTGRILEEFYKENDSGSLLDTILFMDLVLYNAQGVTLISDISGMSSGLEIRSPFLEHKLVEFVFSLPVNSKIKGLRQTKYILRQAMRDTLPKAVLSRKKVGYGESFPFKEWFRNDWRKAIEQFLFDGGLKKSGLFQMGYVKVLFDEHMNCRQDNFNLLWSLVCFSAWYDAMKFN